MLREIVAAAFFGVQGSISAFTVAFQVPNLVRALVADAALGAAFVPVFNDLLQRGERERAWRVASSVFWLSFVGLSAVTLVFEVLAPQVMAIFGYHSSLAVGLARVMFPTLVLFGLAGVVNAMLNAFDEFFVPALAPVAWNVVIIAVLVGAAPFWHSIDDRLYAYAIGILLGTVVQFALPLPLAARPRRPPQPHARHLGPARAARLRADAAGLARPRADQRQPADRHLVRDTGQRRPRARGDRQGVPHLHAAAGDVLGRRRDGRVPGALARGERARRTRLPADAGDGAPADRVPARARPRSRSRCSRSRWCASSSSTGSFDAAQTHVVAQALAAFSLGLTFNGIMLMLNRAFFSLQMPWGPTRIAVATLVANVVLDALFYRPFGVWGIPFATSFVNIVGTFLLSRSLKPLVGPFITPRFRRAMIVIVARRRRCSRACPTASGTGSTRCSAARCPAQVVSLLLGARASAALAYLWTAKRLGLDELRALAPDAPLARPSSALLAEVPRASREDHLAPGEPARDLVQQELARWALRPPTRARAACGQSVIASIRRVSPKRARTRAERARSAAPRARA